MAELRAPMAGSVWKVECTAGEIVAENDVVIILEAMKMETELFAPSAGKISQIRVKEGDTVEEDDVLLVIEAG